MHKGNYITICERKLNQNIKSSTGKRVKNIVKKSWLLMIELKKWKKQKFISPSKIMRKAFPTNCHSV